MGEVIILHMANMDLTPCIAFSITSPNRSDTGKEPGTSPSTAGGATKPKIKKITVYNKIF